MIEKISTQDLTSPLFDLTTEEVLENSFDSIMVKRFPDMKTIYINKGPTEKMFGFPVTNFYEGKVKLCIKDDEPIYMNMLNACKENGDAESKFRCRKMNGEIVWVLHRMRLLKDSDQRPLAIVGNCIDITDMVNLEQKMISNARLTSMSEISNGMAHEINNPLMIVSGGLDRLNRFIQNLNNKAEAIKISHKMKSSVERIADIINGLKAFSRSSALDIKEDILVKTILDEVIKYCGERLRNMDIELKINLNVPPNTIISVRKHQIIHALLNLINNSYDAVQGHIEKRIAFNVDLENEQIRFSVIDSGPGVPHEIIPKIMEPFFTTKEIGKGTGLGLSVAKGIAEDHGGILFYDTQSRVTCFKMVIPKDSQMLT